MISCFPYLGIVEQRPGVTDDANLPPTMQVSTFPPLLMLPHEPPRVELSDPWAGRFAWRRSDNGG